VGALLFNKDKKGSAATNSGCGVVTAEEMSKHVKTQSGKLCDRIKFLQINDALKNWSVK